MKFVSRSVMTGFVNALAILIFLAQMPQLTHVGWQTYAMVAAGLAIIYLFPLLTKRVPSALVSIIVLTGFTIFSGIKLQTVGDMGELPSSLPVLRDAAGAFQSRDVEDHPAVLIDDGCGRPAEVAADRIRSSTT